MTSRSLRSGAFAGALLGALFAATVGAKAQTAPASPSVLIVHGIEGTDSGSANLPTLPVNIKIDSTCLQGIGQFGDALGPYPLATGSHTITFYPANLASPCSGTSVVNQTISLTAGQQLAFVAAEGANQVFTLNLGTAIPTGSAQAIVLNATNASAPLDVLFYTGKKLDTELKVIAAGGQQTYTITPFSNYLIKVILNGTPVSDVIAGPLGISAANRAAELVFLVGSSANGTVTAIRREIPAILY